MSDSSILVTGGSGFTGGYLARRLQADGYDVRLLIRSKEKADGLRSLGFKVVEGDLANASAVDQAVAGVDTIYHVAALYRSDVASDKLFHEVNVEGTRTILEAAKRHRVRRIVHTSTVGVHGNIKNPPADETCDFAPRDAYQQSKVDGERLVETYRQKGMDIVIVRPVGIFGPGDTRFLKLFRAIAKKRFVMVGSGKSLYQLTYIDDLVEGLRLCGEKPEAVCGTFIIGGPPAVRLNELVSQLARVLNVPEPRMRVPLWPFQLVAPACQAVCRAIGVEPPLYPRRLEFFSDDRSFSTAKAERLLGYRPKVSLEEGLRRTAEWYRSQKWL